MNQASYEWVCCILFYIRITATEIEIFLRLVIQMGILANMQISHTFALIYFEKSTHDTFNRIQIESIHSIPHREGIPTFWARLNDVDAEYRKRKIKRRNLPRFRCDNHKSGMNIIILILLIPLGVVFSPIIIQYSWHVLTTLHSIFSVILWFRIVLSFACQFFIPPENLTSRWLWYASRWIETCERNALIM